MLFRSGTLKGESVSRIAFMKAILESMPGNTTLFQTKSMAIGDQKHLQELMAAGTPGLSDNLILKCMCRVTEAEFEHLTEIMAQPIIQTGEDAYLMYLGEACTIYTTIDLPKDHTYTVEIIDVWEMTREVVREGVSGHVEINLPGKGGMAVFARREVK